MSRVGTGRLALAATLGGMAMVAAAETIDARQISDLTGIPRGDLQVLPVEVEGLAGCPVFDALDRRVKGPGAATPVALVGGEWRRADDPGTAAQVLDACADTGTDAAVLADLIGTLNPGARLDVVRELSSPLVDTMLRKAGREFAPPASRPVDRGVVVTFLALGPDGQSLHDVEATWHPGGELVVSAPAIPGAVP